MIMKRPLFCTLSRFISIYINADLIGKQSFHKQAVDIQISST